MVLFDNFLNKFRLSSILYGNPCHHKYELIKFFTWKICRDYPVFHLKDKFLIVSQIENVFG